MAWRQSGAKPLSEPTMVKWFKGDKQLYNYELSSTLTVNRFVDLLSTQQIVWQERDCATNSNQHASLYSSLFTGHILLI